ncbi:MAG TPA: efflux RND transporter periplasmic adaptor subunit [Steroidobacteraceae bacterium]|jgi:RND family efflux transporter MFP subunit
MHDVAGPVEPPSASSECIPRSLRGPAIVAISIAAIVVAWGIVARRDAHESLANWTVDQSIPTVALIQPKSQGANNGLVLPGSVQALNSAPIYARTNGYVSSWLVDIGASVDAGQLLATIDAPEVEQQLAAAQAELKTAEANRILAESTAIRWQGLLEKKAVSKQENDERIGDLAAKRAAVDAATANVARLSALVGFGRIVAPFAGVITLRQAQIGQLVTVGDAAAAPLFTVSDIHRMRIYVRVPQSFSGQVRIGESVELSLPEYPGKDFDATVIRTDGAVDRESGTMLVEMQAANPRAELKPGAYAQVRVPVADMPQAVVIPASAVLFRSDGTLVATVAQDSKVSLRHISIGRDWGETLEVTTGLALSERVIDNPPDSIIDGDLVRVLAP